MQSSKAQRCAPLIWAQSTEMSAPLLSITDLRAGYGKAEVLHGLNLHAHKGSVITVIDSAYQLGTTAAPQKSRRCMSFTLHRTTS